MSRAIVLIGLLPACGGRTELGSAISVQADAAIVDAAMDDASADAALDASDASVLFRKVSAGQAHTCGIKSSGALTCWGSNDRGELGDGTTTPSFVPVLVRGLPDAIANVTAATSFTCAVTVGGAAWCWGVGTVGELGNGSKVDSLVPVQVAGLSSGVRMVSGQEAACALLSSGGVVCWGDNGLGQMGNGTTTPSSVPASVSGLSSGVATISEGLLYGCAVKVSGEVVCWGHNDYGVLGDGTFDASLVPVTVKNLPPATDVSACLSHTCAIAGESVYCWGDNQYGELGDGTTTPSLVPVQVHGLTGAPLQVAAGFDHTCVRTTTGVSCFGMNLDGELGLGTSDVAPHPASTAISGVVGDTVTAGSFDTCLATDAGILCWGAGEVGQLGNGSNQNALVPTPVVGF